MNKMHEALIEAAKIGFFSDHSKTKYWPIPAKWELIDTDQSSSNNDFSDIQIQHYDSGMIVRFKGSKIASGKGHGTYIFHDFGKRYEASFTSVDDVPKICKEIIDGIAKRQVDAITRLSSKLHGWKIKGDLSSSLEAEFELGNNLYLDANIYIYTDETEVDVVCADHGTSDSARNLAEKNFKVKDLMSVGAQLHNFESECRKKFIK